MKTKLFVAVIALVLITSAAFADGDKRFGIIAGGEFQTQDGFGSFPFLGFDAGLECKIYDNIADHDLWIRVLYQKNWQLNIANPKISPRNYIRSTLSIGPEFVLELDDFLIGIGPGFLHRVTQRGDYYSTEYGVYVEGSAHISNDPERSIMLLKPVVSLKYLFQNGLELGIGLRVPLRFF